MGIALGRAFSQALGDRRGIVRMAHAIVPLDESLALVAVDISGRGYSVIDLPFATPAVGGLSTSLIPHFLESFASASAMNIQVQLLRGGDDHHRAEATFKALARALAEATRIDPRRANQIPSTKGIIEK
jgi:imidazoleglycerol-phosphate dehydratase